MALSSSNSIIQSHSSSSSVANFRRKRRIIRSQNNNLLIVSTIAIIIVLSSSSSYAASPSFTGGLRGQQLLNDFEQQQQQHQVVLDILSSRLPQHSQRGPRRPSHEDVHHNNNKLPPSHDDGHRRLVVHPSTTTTTISTASDEDGDISEPQLQTQPQRRTGEKGRATENQKRKEANKRLKKMKQKNKKKISGGQGGGQGGGGRNKPNNKKPGRSNNNKKNKKPQQGGGGGNSNGRSNKKPKRPGRFNNNKPNNNKPNKPKNPGRPGKNKPGGGGGGKNKPNQQGGGGGRPNNNNNMASYNGSNNKPQAAAQSYIVIKPGIEDKDDKSSKDDFDNIKPQSDKPPKPKPQSSYQVVKPGIEDKEDKPNKPNNKPPKPQQQSQGIINIKPGKLSSSLELALAHLGIPLKDWDALKPNEQADILHLIDGEFNIDSQDKAQDQEDEEELITNDANAATTDTTTSTATATATSSISNNIIPLKWNFVPKLTTDTTSSTLLDSFEFTSNLHWDQHPSWIISDDYAYSGSKSIQSGLLLDNVNVGNDGGSKPIYSNLTLVTDPMFEGGVLTFQIKSGGSNKLPIEAFWVEVDGMILLPPDEVAMKSSGSGSGSTSEWVEYSVPVKKGEHQVKWVHVYNPFGLHSLPLSSSSSSGGLYMDELRYVPFTLSSSSLDDATIATTTQGGVVEMTNNNDAKWEVITNGNIVMASSSSINDVDSSGSGSADIEFDLYSLNGGQLTYRVQTSTTGPHDDLTIYINDQAVESVFGDMLGYESRSLDVPGGKARVTFSHRTNPGKLSESVLEGLGDVGTDGKTWLKNLNFDSHVY